MKTLLMLAGLL